MSIIITETQLDFTLGAKIGKGGEGDVYEALDHQLNAKLAIKQTPRAKFKTEKLFFEESKKLYLTRHRNVVPVNYATKNNDFIYLAMPLFEKGSLKSICDNRFLTAREIIRYSLQFLSGLHHIHSKRLIHFDVKLENILISDSNQALISDFGLAQHTGNFGFAQQFGTTRVLAPPEYFQQQKHNYKFDIYQAGMTLLRMCIGDKALEEQVNIALLKRGVKNYDNLIEKISLGKFPNRSNYPPHIPIQLRKVIKKSLSPDPNIRYDSILEMLNELAKITPNYDWQFISNFAGNEEWTFQNKEVTANLNGENWSISCLKNGRRVTRYCVNSLNHSEKNKLLQKCLMDKL